MSRAVTHRLLVLIVALSLPMSAVAQDAPPKTPITPPQSKGFNAQAMQLYKDAQFLIQDGWEEGQINYALIERKLRECISKEPAYTPAYLLLGKTFEDRQDWKNAENAYRDASRNSVDKETGFIQLARIYTINGKVADARKVLDSVMLRSPNNAEAKASMAALMRREGDLVGAEKLLREGLAHNADSVATYKELALVHLQSKNYNIARLSLLKAMKLKDDDAAIHNTMGLIHLKENDENKAVESFKRAIEVDEQYLPAHMNLSALYLKHGYFEKAMNELKIAERLKSGDTSIITSLGVAYRGTGDFAKAEESFKRALSIDSSYQPAIFNLGVLYYRYLGDRNKATAFFKDYSGDKAGGKANTGVENVNAYLDRIELSISKQTEIGLMEDRETDALSRYERAVTLRLNTEKRVREIDQAIYDMGQKRAELEVQAASIDKQANDSRNRRFEAEKKLAETIAGMSEARAKISKADSKLLEAQGRIIGLQSKRQQASEEISGLFKERVAVKRQKRAVDDQLRDLEKKLSLNPAKDLANSLANIEKDLEKLDDRYNSNADQLGDLQDRREKMVARLGKLVTVSQEVNGRRSGNDSEFNQRAKELFDIENRINANYEEMRNVEKNRLKFEATILSNNKTLSDLEAQGAEIEKELRTVMVNRELETALLNLDKQREAGGAQLETYELQRQELIDSMSSIAKLVEEKRAQMREANQSWDKVVDQSLSLHDKINSLEDERAQVEVKTATLLVERKRARFLIDEVLRKRKNIDEATDKIEKRIADHLAEMTSFDKKWDGLIAERETLVEQIGAGDKKRQQIWDSLGKARLAAGSSLNDPISVKEYRDRLQDQLIVNDKLNEATNAWLQKIRGLKSIEESWSKVSGEIDAHLQERVDLAGKWQEKRSQRDQLLADRNKNDQITVELRQQRDKLEESRLAIENKRKDFLENRSKVANEQVQQFAAELALEKELLDQAEKRRQAVKRDLLREFTDKKSSNVATGGAAPAVPKKTPKTTPSKAKKEKGK